jgi:hypothetical protein
MSMNPERFGNIFEPLRPKLTILSMKAGWLAEAEFDEVS